MNNFSSYHTQPVPIKVFKVVEDTGNQLLEFIDVVTNYTSYTFSRSFVSIGTFEIIINGDLEKSSVFQQDYVIQIGDDHNKQGQIKKIARSITTSGGVTKNLITLKGPQLKHIMQGALICPPASLQYPDYISFYGEVFTNEDEDGAGSLTHEVYNQVEIADIMVDLVKKGRTTFTDTSGAFNINYPMIPSQAIGNLVINGITINTITVADADFSGASNLITLNDTILPSDYVIGTKVRVEGSTSNDGTYIIDAINLGAGWTQLEVTPVDGINCIAGVDNPIYLSISEAIDYMVRFKDLNTCLAELCELSDYGWTVHYDLVDEEWVFNIIEGIDRTNSQSTNDWAIFSFDRGNVSSVKYDEDFTTYNNDVVVAGTAEMELRHLYYLNNPTNATGVFSKVAFRDARDVNDDGLDYSELELLRSRADEQLEKDLYKQTLEVKGFVGKSTLVVDTDYTLGDYASINVSDWGIVGSNTIDLQLTKITEAVKKDTLGTLDFTFGNNPNTLSRLFRRELNKYALTITI